THDLMVSMIQALGRQLEQVRITRLERRPGGEGGIFYAELVFDGGTVLSSRPSDAIALALRTAAPILASEELLEEVGVTMAVAEEDEVERIRECCDSVSAEDFEEGTE